MDNSCEYCAHEGGDCAFEGCDFELAEPYASGPGMLEMLEYADSLTEGINPPDGTPEDDAEIITIQMTVRGWRDIRAAIAKAKGERS